MTGLPFYNFPVFTEVAKSLRQDGYSIISPHEIDWYLGYSEFTDPTPEMMKQFVAENSKIIINRCQGIALIAGWDNSNGCMGECALGIQMGYPFMLAKTRSLIPHDQIAQGISNYLRKRFSLD